MAQLSSRNYLKFTLVIVGVVNLVFGILLLTSGFKIKEELDDLEIDTKNYVEASQYWAGIPIILIGLFTIAVAFHPKKLTLYITKVLLLTSLILSLAVIVAEAGDRGLVYALEIVSCKLAETYKSDPFGRHDNTLASAHKKQCSLFSLARHWYGTLVFSAVIIFGSSLMGLLSLFANISSPLGETSGINLNSMSME